MVNLPAYLPCWTISVTTWMFLGVAFWPRMPVWFHSLRSPVSKSALKIILAEAGPVTQNRPAETIKGTQYRRGSFTKAHAACDVIWILPWDGVRLPVCHRYPAWLRRF